MKSILHESNNKDILHSNVLHLHDFRLMKTTLSIMTIIEVNDGQGDGPDQQANQQTFIGPLKGPKTLSFNFLGAWLWPATGFSFISLVFGSSKPFIVGHKEFMCVQKTSACHVFMDYCSWSKRTFSNLTYSEFQGQINLILRWKFLWISVKLWANIWNIWQRRSLEKPSRWKKGMILGIGRSMSPHPPP